MSVDFAQLFQTFYPPGPGRQYVNPSTGNDSNAGTVGSPKRTIGGAQASLGGGGIIWCADGEYGEQSISGTYSVNANLLVMAQNIEGPTIHCNGGHGIVLNGNYIGIFGFHTFGNDSISSPYQKGIVTGGPSTHLAIWKNHCELGGEAGIGLPSQGYVTDYIDIAYNVVHDNARWFSAAGSGISIYEARAQNNNAGYHINIVGNRCYNNHNDPGATANSDGNGIILDDFMNTQFDGVNNGNAMLVHQNLCLHNGGRGTHAPWTSNVDMFFNTNAMNGWTRTDTNAGETCISGGRCQWNATKPDSAGSQGVAYQSTIDNYFPATYGGTVTDNLALAGSGYHGSSPRSRTGEGLNYFKNNTPTLAPSTLALADQWRPDGGSGAVEKVTLDQATYDALAKWPDMFGDYRPARTSGWALGFTEASATAVTTGTMSHPSLGTHGHLLTSSAQGTSPAGHARYLITYQMTSVQGNGGGLIPASGIAYIPSGAAPAGGWPFITAAHGIMGTGLKDSESCSFLFPNDTFENSCGAVDNWLNQGFAVVQTDYEGLLRGGDSAKSPAYVSLSVSRAMLDAAVALSGIASISTKGASVGFSQGGHAALCCGENTSYQPQITQFCSVGFDPWMSADTISGYYDGFGSVDPISQWVFGLYLADNTLPLATILNAGGVSVLPTIDTLNQPWPIGAPAYGGGANSFIADPTKAGGGWSTACTANTPGHSIAVASRAYSPANNSGLPYADRWLTYATASGTQASRYVSNSQNGHFVSQEYIDDAIPWVKARLASQLPSANFTYLPSTVVVNQIVSFTDASTGVPTSWTYAWGDGTANSTTQSPTHTFTTVGSYAVTLTATNASGTSTVTKTVVVNAQPSGGGFTLEAEAATVTSGYPGDSFAAHIVADNPGFTGTGYLGFFGQLGEKLVWSFTAPNGAGTYAVTFRYRTNDAAATRTVWVNGVSQGTLSLTKNANAFTDNIWSGSTPINVVLPAGTSTLEMRFAGTSFTGYADIDSGSLAGGGASTTVVAASVRAVAGVPGVSVLTAAVVDARPLPASIAAVTAMPAIVFTRSATVVAFPVTATAQLGVGTYGDIPIIHATVLAAPIACTAVVPTDYDIEAMRMLAGRYRLLGHTRQRITG